VRGKYGGAVVTLDTEECKRIRDEHLILSLEAGEKVESPSLDELHDLLGEAID